MKRTVCLLIGLFMLVSLCGCFGNDNENDIRGEVINGNTTETDNNDENVPEFSLGDIQSNTYSNEFLEISCTLPSEWVFYTDEQILQLNNLVGDAIDEDIAKQLENAAIVYDMYATNEAEGSNINVNLEKLNAAQLLTLDVKATLEAQIDTIKTAYTGMGYTDVEVAYQKVTVDGKEFDGLKFDAKIQGIDFYGTCFTFLKGSYLANVTICTLVDDKNDTVLGYFDVK